VLAVLQPRRQPFGITCLFLLARARDQQRVAYEDNRGYAPFKRGIPEAAQTSIITQRPSMSSRRTCLQLALAWRADIHLHLSLTIVHRWPQKEKKGRGPVQGKGCCSVGQA
jgi:hypothetical protein